VFGQNKGLINLIKGLESDIPQVAERVENLFNSRCSSNWKKSYHSCSDKLPEFTCDSNFIIKDCSCSKIQGTMLNSQNSAVILQTKNIPYTDLTDQKDREMIIAFSGIDQEFKYLKEKYPDLKKQFIGTYRGIHRRYPLHEFCDAFDPRERPWYILAATGSKNLILVFDISKSMDSNNRFFNSKKAAKKLIESLNYNDWINIVIFSDTVESRFPILQRATRDIRENIVKYIDGLKASGETNYEAAIRSIYNIFGNSKANELGCQSIVIFLTDGEPTVGETDANNLLKLINEIDKFDTIWFGYAIGFNKDPKVLKAITCAKNGITEPILDGEIIEDALMSYNLIISTGLQRDKIIWTESYEDTSGLGKIMTAVFPIYERSGKDPFLIGVLGFNIVFNDFINLENSEDLIRDFFSGTRYCSPFTISECQMESLRKFKCFSNQNLVCEPLKRYHTVCENDIFEDVFVKHTNIQQNLNKNLCCSENRIFCFNNSIGVIVGSCVGGFVTCCILLCICCYLIRKCNIPPPIINRDPEGEIIDEKNGLKNPNNNVNKNQKPPSFDNPVFDSDN